MSVFAPASNKSGASVTLAVTHYILCKINSGESLDVSDNRIYEVSQMASQGTGQTLADASFQAVLLEFRQWYAQDQVDLTHVFDSLVSATKTLRKHWKTGDAGKEELLVALESLANGKQTEIGEKSLRAIMRHLGVD